MPSIKRFVMAKKFLALANKFVTKIQVTAKSKLPIQWMQLLEKNKSSFMEDLDMKILMDSLPTGDREHFILLSIPSLRSTDAEADERKVLNALRAHLMASENWKAAAEKIGVDLTDFQGPSSLLKSALKIPFVLSPDEASGLYKEFRSFLQSLYNEAKGFMNTPKLKELELSEDADEATDEEVGLKPGEEPKERELDLADDEIHLSTTTTKAKALTRDLVDLLRSAKSAVARKDLFAIWDAKMKEIISAHPAGSGGNAAELADLAERMLNDGTKVDAEKLASDAKYGREIRKRLSDKVALPTQTLKKNGFSNGERVKLIEDMVGLKDMANTSSGIQEYYDTNLAMIQKLMTALDKRDATSLKEYAKEKDKNDRIELNKKKGAPSAPKTLTFIDKFKESPAGFEAYLRSQPMEIVSAWLRDLGKWKDDLEREADKFGREAKDKMDPSSFKNLHMYKKLYDMMLGIAREMRSEEVKRAEQFTEKADQFKPAEVEPAPEAKPAPEAPPAKPASPTKQLNLF